MGEIVHIPHPMHPGPVEIDDSRLQSMWMRQHRRSMLTTGALCLIGVAGTLVAVAMVIWAARLGHQAPPVVNIAPPAVNVTVPPPQVAAQTPLLPQAPAPTPQPGESKVVTEYTIFHTTQVDNYVISTGWQYHNSNDTEPYSQFCHWHVSRNHKVILGNDGEPAKDLAKQVQALGVNLADAVRYSSHCKWFGNRGSLRF
jgi:hypothetical protein